MVELLAQALRLGNTLIDKYVTDPEHKAKARREYLDGLQEIRAKIAGETDLETLDRLLLDLVAAIHGR